MAKSINGKTVSCTVLVFIPVSGVSLSSNQLIVGIGSDAQLTATVSPSAASDETVVWSSSNLSVVSVSQDGLVSGLSEGNATITVKTNDGGYTASCEVEVIDYLSPKYMVDLGLSVKWAAFNFGASKPEGYGGYFGSESEDIVHAELGGKWRMPTIDEFQELLDNCTTEWTMLNGVNGRKLTSKKNGNSIFFPAAGYLYGGRRLDYAGSSGHYWSSSLSTYFPDETHTLYFNSDSVYTGSRSRYRFDRLSVRPVSE